MSGQIQGHTPEPNALMFSELRARSVERAKLWNKDGATVPMIFSLVELAGEAGEALEAVEAVCQMVAAANKACNVGKKLARTEIGLAGGTVDIDPLVDEIADVVICADLVAQKLRIDLGAAVCRKFNATSDKRGFSVKLSPALSGISESPEEFVRKAGEAIKENNELRAASAKEFVRSDERAWMVTCPPTDECDYRVYFTHADAEVADEGFREDALTDEDDAERRTQGVSGLVQAGEANARIRTLRERVAALTAERDAAKAEASKQTIKAECYGSKLFGVVCACKDAGITLEHKGLGQGWTEECGKIITTIASLTAQRDAMVEALTKITLMTLDQEYYTNGDSPAQYAKRAARAALARIKQGS